MESNISNFKLEYRISNNSNNELVVKTQGGLNYIIRKAGEYAHPNSQSRKVFIKITGVKFKDLWLDPKNARTRFDMKVLELLKIEADKVKTLDEMSYNKFSHNLSVVVTLSTSLADENDIIHSDILGISLYSDKEAARVSPICSPEFTLNQLLDGGKDVRSNQPNGGLHYFVYLNDPLSKMRPLYTNVMGKAIQVPIVNEPAKPGGLYIGFQNSNLLPQTIYYTFDELGKDELDSLGLFQTREECALGGNTERALSAENKLKSNYKVIENLQGDKAKLEDLLIKSEQSVAKLGNELLQAKAEHRQEIIQMKNDHKMDLLKNQMSQEALKASGVIKETVAKANMELDKKRNNANNFGEVAKAVGAIASIVATGYKLYTS